MAFLGHVVMPELEICFISSYPLLVFVMNSDTQLASVCSEC